MSDFRETLFELRWATKLVISDFFRYAKYPLIALGSNIISDWLSTILSDGLGIADNPNRYVLLPVVVGAIAIYAVSGQIKWTEMA